MVRELPMANRREGARERDNACNLLGARDIQSAVQAQTNGVKMNGTIMACPTGAGMSSVTSVMAE